MTRSGGSAEDIFTLLLTLGRQYGRFRPAEGFRWKTYFKFPPQVDTLEKLAAQFPQ